MDVIKEQIPMENSQTGNIVGPIPLVVAVTAAAVGWLVFALEKRRNAELYDRLERLERALTIAKGRDDAIAENVTHMDKTVGEEAVSESVATFNSIKNHLEALQQEDLLIAAENEHLLVLKDELEELKRDMEETLSAASAPLSGHSTPCAPTPTHRSLSLASLSPEQASETPSPPAMHHSIQMTTSTTTGNSQVNLKASFDATTPQKQQADIAVSTSLSESLELALATPIPVTDDFSDDDWDNDEEWLLKTARGVVCSESEEDESTTPIIRPLPRVHVPRLHLPGSLAHSNSKGKITVNTSSSTGSCRTPLTLSVRGGIKSRGSTTGKTIELSCDKSGKDSPPLPNEGNARQQRPEAPTPRLVKTSYSQTAIPSPMSIASEEPGSAKRNGVSKIPRLHIP